MNEMELIANRKLAIYHLRVNPNNRKWGHGKLKDSEGNVCALGLMAEAFGIDTDPGYPGYPGYPRFENGEIDWDEYRRNEPYGRLQALLGVDMMFTNEISEFNDGILGFKFKELDDNQKFAKAADFAERILERYPL